jgi:hypothetical protein
VPEVLVTGGGGAIEGLAATFMRALNGKHEGNGDSSESAGHQENAENRRVIASATGAAVPE